VRTGLIDKCRATTSTKQKKSVQFNVPPPIQHSHSAPTLHTTSTELKQQEAPIEIVDLCATIATLDGKSTYIGYVQDLEARHHELHCVNSAQREGFVKPVELVTLASLLDDTRKLGWSTKARFQLTLILASSLLQLQTTPWTTGRFTKNDILLEKSDNTILASHPYIQYTFTTHNSPVGTNAKSMRGLVKRLTRASFVSLGIILLELLNNCHIETQYELYGSNLGDDCSPEEVNIKVADEWMEDIPNETISQYYDAVKACFEHEIKPDWTDEAFLTSTHARIVKNLETVLDHYGWRERGGES
jgi:hypothetical protein